MSDHTFTREDSAALRELKAAVLSPKGLVAAVARLTELIDKLQERVRLHEAMLRGRNGELGLVAKVVRNEDRIAAGQKVTESIQATMKWVATVLVGAVLVQLVSLTFKLIPIVSAAGGG